MLDTDTAEMSDSILVQYIMPQCQRYHAIVVVVVLLLLVLVLVLLLLLMLVSVLVILLSNMFATH